MPTLPKRPPLSSPLGEPFQMACFVFCVAQIVYLAASFVLHQWLIDPLGRGIPTDFVNVWAAGKLVLAGQPAVAYDWDLHKEIENAAVGYNFPGYYGWHYPPPMLAIAALLALFPYTAAYAGWVAVTLPAYVAMIRWLAGAWIGYLLAFAFPAVLSNAMVGQNGFLTASLIGGTLGFMQKRPVLSGVCLGLLTYKPQFGVLFPLALIATQKWKVFFVAAVVAISMAAASVFAFGIESWQAFVHWLPITSKTFLSEGQANFGKLQSLYGLVRVLHGFESLAWVLQIILSASTAVTVCFFWHKKKPFALQAALLGVGTLLATPYVYLYDTVVLAVPVALLVRVAIKTGFFPGEQPALLIAALLILSFPFLELPVGFVAIVIVAALILRRIVLAKNTR
jgi:arabinofuranan 3-O-arabinosyltransferase